MNRNDWGRKAVAMAALGLLSACGTSTGSGGSGGTGSTGSIAAADLPKAVEDAMCTVATTCTDGFEFTFSSVENCKAFAASSGELGGVEDLAYVTKGTVDYDPAKAAACLAAMKATCDFKNEPEACDQTFQGKLEADAACESSVECKGDAECVTDNMGCNGKCKARAAEGEACKEVGCQKGFVCDYQSDKCVVEKLGAKGDDCDSNQCGAGLFCDYNNGGGGGVPKCRELGAEGAACDDHEQCAEGLGCANDKCAKPGAMGDACDDPGETRVCVAGHVCAIIGKLSDKTAKCLHTVKAGEKCTSHMQCAQIDIYCKGLETGATEGTCETLPKIGEACTPPGNDFPQFFACLTGYCDPTSKKCETPKGKGEACGQGVICGPGLDCNDDGSGKDVCTDEKTSCK